jgi:4-amino-4-deoxy-L-arabinose transferase-like glycosyltransferase
MPEQSGAWPLRLRGHAGPVLAVMVWVAGLHAVVIARAEVASRDSIGFIRYALHLETPPPDWHDPDQPGRQLTRAEVIQRAEHPPGYPLAVLVASWPLRAWMGGVHCDSMVLACQLASSIAGVWLVVPIYLLGLWLHGRTVGLSAALVFSSLPVAAQVTSDGLADGLYLFWLACALAGCVWGLRQRSWPGFALGGLATALAYWTRPEALMLPVAVLIVLAGLGLRRTWPARLAATLAVVYLATTLAVASPYVWLIGGLTNKPTPRGLLDGQPPSIPGHSQATPRVGGGLWAVWFQQRDLGTVTVKLSGELLKTTNYVLLPLGLAGFWLSRRRLSEPAPMLLVVLGGINLALLWRLGSVMGYTSERHFLLVALILTIWATPPHITYVVVEQSTNQHSRLPMLPIAREVARHGQVVYAWPENRPIEQAVVLVARVEH